MTIFLTIIGINIAILVGFLLGVVTTAQPKPDHQKNVGTLYIYEDPADGIDHVYADFTVDIPTIQEMEECEFTIDTSVHFPKIR
jgi:hypothetical protein